ncbi:hypothetical protein DF186_14490, partial [Enterococcus hirae]
PLNLSIYNYPSNPSLFSFFRNTILQTTPYLNPIEFHHQSILLNTFTYQLLLITSSNSKKQKKKKPVKNISSDEKKFKTTFHKLEFKRIKLKKILPELTSQIEENEYPQ